MTCIGLSIQWILMGAAIVYKDQDNKGRSAYMPQLIGAFNTKIATR